VKHLVWLLLVLAAGCAALGVPTPQTFSQKLAAGYSAVTAVVDDTRILLAAKKLTPADAENVVKQTDNLVAALDIARQLSGTSPVAANDKLSATLLALTALQTYLATKKGTP
jgi:hypothetical protein